MPPNCFVYPPRLLAVAGINFQECSLNVRVSLETEHPRFSLFFHAVLTTNTRQPRTFVLQRNKFLLPSYYIVIKLCPVKRTIWTFEPDRDVASLLGKEMRRRGGKRRGLLRSIINDCLRANLSGLAGKRELAK